MQYGTILANIEFIIYRVFIQAQYSTLISQIKYQGMQPRVVDKYKIYPSPLHSKVWFHHGWGKNMLSWCRCSLRLYWQYHCHQFPHHHHQKESQKLTDIKEWSNGIFPSDQEGQETFCTSLLEQLVRPQVWPVTLSVLGCFSNLIQSGISHLRLTMTTRILELAFLT